MRAALAMSAAAASALAPVAVNAQARIDHSAAVSTRDLSPGGQARDTMNRYAECIVKMHAAAVRRALAQPTYEGANAQLARLAGGECLAGGDLIMGESLFRGAIYRALYIRDFGRLSALPGGDGALPQADDPMLVFGDCVARLDAEQTRAFVVARPASVEESDAVAKLGPSFGRCLAPGNQARFSKTVLQGALAEALYKRTSATAVPAELAEVK